ncbi:hypothetical protein D3C85_1767740 [compost metagenome]
MICSPGLFFSGDVLVQIRDRIALSLDIGSCPRNTGRILIEEGVIMGDIIFAQPLCIHLLYCSILGQLIDHRRDHFKVGKFFCSMKL